MNRIEITGELITLGQFLKFAGIVDSGGDARALLDDEGVLVNGDIEVRRGRKLRSGDVVTAFNEEYLVTRKSV